MRNMGEYLIHKDKDDLEKDLISYVANRERLESWTFKATDVYPTIRTNVHKYNDLRPSLSQPRRFMTRMINAHIKTGEGRFAVVAENKAVEITVWHKSNTYVVYKAEDISFDEAAKMIRIGEVPEDKRSSPFNYGSEWLAEQNQSILA